jgi:hypothetical protein
VGVGVWVCVWVCVCGVGDGTVGHERRPSHGLPIFFACGVLPWRGLDFGMLGAGKAG